MATTIIDAITTMAAMTNDFTTTSVMSKDSTTAVAQVSWAKELADNLHFVMSAVIAPIFCFLGMVANILSIFVWNRPSMRSSTGRYLTGQAIADFFVLFFFIVCDSANAWDSELKTRNSYGVFFSYIGYPFLHLSVVCSIWFTVGVTTDRYIMVCWITKAKAMCSEKRATFCLILITVCAFVVNIPHFFSFEPVDDVNSTAKFQYTEFGDGPGGNFYEFWIHCIILILIPWGSVLFMNIQIIRKIKKSNKRTAKKKTNESMKKSKESQNQITRILLAVTFSFLFFIGTQCIIQCFWMQKPKTVDMNAVSAAYAFAKTGIVFNSSLNFLFYCLTGRRFRNELKSMLGLEKEDVMVSSLVNTPSTRSTSNATSSSSTTGI